MGWFGYGIYDGDGTQTSHYTFIKKARIEKNDDVINDWLGTHKTKIPKDAIRLLKVAANKLHKSVNKYKYLNEDRAIESQMLAALFLDNGVYHKEIYDSGVKASIYLLGDHSDDFDNPSRRRKALNAFINKLKKYESNSYIR